jgi:hypothetical protein
MMAMSITVISSTFSFYALYEKISLKSLKLYSGISNTTNHDIRGSIIFSQELAVTRTDEDNFICLVLLILVSTIIPVSIKYRSEV